MQTLSATAALSPAFTRTKLVLFSPFLKGRTWKLSATAYIATVSAIFLPFPLIYLAFLPRVLRFGNMAATALVAGILFATALFLFIFHLCSRIRFAFFDLVLNRGSFVAPAWRKYGHQSLKWTAIKVVIGTVITAALALPTAAYFRKISAVVATIAPGQQPSPHFLISLFAGYFLIYFAFGLAFFMGSILSDFIVPSLALENTTLGEAFRRLGELIRNEPGEFFAYTLLKFVLGFAAYIGTFIAFEIVFILALIVVGIIAGIAGYLLHLAGVPTGLLMALAIVLGVAFYLFFIFYCLVIMMGAMLTYFESYTLYFLGGRYPLLGDLLDRSSHGPNVFEQQAEANFMSPQQNYPQ